MLAKKNQPYRSAMKWLKRLREGMGLSRYNMAKRLGMINNSYLYLEAKAKGCNMETLVEIKRVSGLTWNEIGEMIEKDARDK